MNVRYVIHFVHGRKGDRDSNVFVLITINKYNLSYYT